MNYHFTKRDSNLFFKGYANSQNLFIDTLLIPNKMTLTHKWERKNFLAKKKYLVEVTNSNPYVSVVGLNNYTFVEEVARKEGGNNSVRASCRIFFI